jgi:putative ATP-dependent endonuclease of OLD family
MKPKKFREERRQFAEAILGRGVIAVEGATEASVLSVVADIMDADTSQAYTHLDLAGVSIYNAGNDVSVPPLGPLFKALGKRTYGLHDTPTQPLTADQVAQTASFDHYLQAPYDGIELLLIAEMPDRPKRAFLATVAGLPDYPYHHGYLAAGAPDADVDTLALKVLKDRKGAFYGYAAYLVAEAVDISELPATYVQFLLAVDADMSASSATATGVTSPAMTATTAGTASTPGAPDATPAAPIVPPSQPPASTTPPEPPQTPLPGPAVTDQS